MLQYSTAATLMPRVTIAATAQASNTYLEHIHGHAKARFEEIDIEYMFPHIPYSQLTSIAIQYMYSKYHVSLLFQWVAASSIANKVPPNGAEKPAATPHPAPALTKSLTWRKKLVCGGSAGTCCLVVPDGCLI